MEEYEEVQGRLLRTSEKSPEHFREDLRKVAEEVLGSSGQFSVQDRFENLT